MTYTLYASITTGRIDTGDGTFDIEDRRVTVDDYETACMLADDYGLTWPDGQPEPPADDADDAGGNDSPDASQSDTSPEADDTDGDDTDDGDVCGYYDDESMDSPCGRDAGWGRDADDGYCKTHIDAEG